MKILREYEGLKLKILQVSINDQAPSEGVYTARSPPIYKASEVYCEEHSGMLELLAHNGMCANFCALRENGSCVPFGYTSMSGQSGHSRQIWRAACVGLEGAGKQQRRPQV